MTFPMSDREEAPDSPMAEATSSLISSSERGAGSEQVGRQQGEGRGVGVARAFLCSFLGLLGAAFRAKDKTKQASPRNMLNKFELLLLMFCS